MVDRVWAEVATELLDEARAGHRSGRGPGRHGGQGDVLACSAAPPFLAGPPLGERAGDLEHPAFMTDGDWRPAITDRRFVRSGARPIANLHRHGVVDAGQVKQLRPGLPRVGEARVV